MKRGCGCAVMLAVGGFLLLVISSAPSDRRGRSTPQPADPPQPAAPAQPSASANTETAPQASPQSPPQQPTAQRGSESQAIVQARDFVRRGLKFPDDSSFPWFATQARYDGSLSAWRVHGKVEAPNGLGIPLTYPYTAVVRLVGNRWECRLLQIGDQLIVDDISDEIAAEYMRLANEAAAKALQEVLDSSFTGLNRAERQARERIITANGHLERGRQLDIDRRRLVEVRKEFPSGSRFHTAASWLLQKYDD